MKKTLVLIFLLFMLALTACETPQNASEEKSKDASGEAEPEKKEMMKLTLSNMADEASLEEVKKALLKELKAENVDSFLKLVTDYNETVEKTGLLGAFKETDEPEYDIATLGELWTAKKGNDIGTNCRINAFTLLKDNLEINKAESDDGLLFMDNDAISTGKLFTGEDTALFRRLFSRVKTEATKDIRVHAEKMKEHFEGIKFSEGARMLSVVIHDTMEGNHLFIGHVGVLVRDGDHYLFVEKLAFEQPYQALKFKTKEECYKYLYSKYDHYSDETSAKPFILDNADLAEPKED